MATLVAQRDEGLRHLPADSSVASGHQHRARHDCSLHASEPGRRRTRSETLPAYSDLR